VLQTDRQTEDSTMTRVDPTVSIHIPATWNSLPNEMWINSVHQDIRKDSKVISSAAHASVDSV